jgi:hypothetical protein
MNRFFLFLAVFSLAFFTACSDDKGPCDDGPSVGCLVGTWRLDGITDGVNGNNASSETGTLKLMSKGGVEHYEFDGGASLPQPFFTTGLWKIDGKNITIENDDTGETLSGTITINGDNAMNIRSATNRAIISLYGEGSLKSPIEKFTRK